MSTPWPSPSSRSLLGVFDDRAGWAGTGTAGRAQGHRRRGEVRGGGEPGPCQGRGQESARSQSWESGLGRCGAEVSAGRPRGSGWPGRGRPAGSVSKGWDRRPPSKPPPRAAVQAPGSGRPTLQSLLPPGFRFPPPAVAEFRSSPGPPLPGPGARRPQGPLRPPRSPGAAGLTWGRGPALPTAPSSSSARQSGLGARAMAGRSGPGHRCHLRNRARRLIPGGPRRRGRSRRGAAPPAGGAGGVPRLQPGPPGASPHTAPRQSVPGPGHRALRSGRGPLGLRKRRSLPPAPSALGALARPPPPSPRFPQIPRAKESQTTPHLFRLPQRKLRPDKRVGLTQGHPARQTPPGKCHPKSCE